MNNYYEVIALKQIRYYKGVWSNGKKTIDLDNLNSKYEMECIDRIYRNSNYSESIVYVTESGTMIEKSSLNELDDWYADLGAITHRETSYKILGKKFKKIKEQGVLDKRFEEYMSRAHSQENEVIENEC